jgi:hypothetical protein
MRSNNMHTTHLVAFWFFALVATTIPRSSLGQTYVPQDVPGFVDFSLKALLDVVSNNPRDRLGARSLLARQLSGFGSAARVAANDALFAKLRADVPQNRNDILGILGAMPVSWTTSNTDADILYLYQQVSTTLDDTAKDLTDSALANAKGMYRDAIASFNSTVLSDLMTGEEKLKKISQRFPASKFGERASFYLAQSYAKRFILKDPAGSSLVSLSNTAFEDYIKRAEKGDFDKHTDYLAGGYYYRALNGWLLNDTKDAQFWLQRGAQKFQNSNDLIYIYQLFVSRDKETVINKYLPAKFVFSSTQVFLDRIPPPSVDQAGDLIGIFRQQT